MSGIVLCIIDVMIKVELSSYNFHIPIPTIANHSSRCGVANHWWLQTREDDHCDPVVMYMYLEYITFYHMADSSMKSHNICIIIILIDVVNYTASKLVS